MPTVRRQSGVRPHNTRWPGCRVKHKRINDIIHVPVYAERICRHRYYGKMLFEMSSCIAYSSCGLALVVL